MTTLPWLWAHGLAWPLALWIATVLAPLTPLQSQLSSARALSEHDSR
jgi:hypothetical protein